MNFILDLHWIPPFDVTYRDIGLIGFLGFLEVLLSLDNALVLAMMAHHLPPKQQKRALTYGLIGAVVFRILALLLATHLMHSEWVKFVGGGYLCFLAVRHFIKEASEDPKHKKRESGPGFWKTVFLIELMDIAFAVDSILAAVALSNRLWIIFIGGFIGVLMIRFAAGILIGLLERFPRFEETAYLLVLIIGVKVILDGCHIPGLEFHSPSSPAFWVFWAVMILTTLLGFRPPKKSR